MGFRKSKKKKGLKSRIKKGFKILNKKRDRKVRIEIGQKIIIRTRLIVCPSGPSIQTVSVNKSNTLNYANSIGKILAMSQKIFN